MSSTVKFGPLWISGSSSNVDFVSGHHKLDFQVLALDHRAFGVVRGYYGAISVACRLLRVFGQSSGQYVVCLCGCVVVGASSVDRAKIVSAVERHADMMLRRLTLGLILGCTNTIAFWNIGMNRVMSNNTRDLRNRGNGGLSCN